MTPQEIDREVELLYAYIKGEVPRSTPDLPKEQADLAASLQAAARQIQPDPRFQTALENQLVTALQNAGPRPGRNTRPSHAGRISWASAIAWGIGALLLLLGLSWVLNNLVPRPAPGARPAIQPVYPAPSAEPAYPYPQPAEPDSPYPGAAYPAPYPPPPNNPGTPAPTVVITASVASEVYSLPQMPDVDFTLQAAFPETPGGVAVYQQAPWPALTVESARSAALRLGIDGEVYQASNDPSESAGFMVSDGFARVTFEGAAPRFQYIIDSRSALSTNQSPSGEQARAAAEDFARQNGPQTFEYRAENDAAYPGLVSLVQTLAGTPVHYYPMGAAQMQIQVSRQGQVGSAISSILDARPVGSYPIISAQEAWQKALSPATQSGVEMFTTSGSQSDRKMWQREYPLGSRVELFGYASAYESVTPGQPPLIVLNDFPLSGNTQGLAQVASANNFLQVWGQFEANTQGWRRLRVEGWQVSAFTTKNLGGTIERQGGQGYLVTADQKLLLPDLPEDVAQGEKVYVSGVPVQGTDSLLDWTMVWTMISTGVMGGGGGGGGTGFSEPNLEGNSGTPLPPEPTPTPAPLPVKSLEGAQGKPMIFIHQYSDGSSKIEATMELEPSPALPDGLYVHLDGPGVNGIEAYHNLPVRVWGTFEDTSGTQTPQMLTVERVEPLYPEAEVQAWLGSAELATLEGQEVLLFTDQQGEQFVLHSSIHNLGSDLDALPQGEGKPLIVEGFQQPDGQFAGYAVLYNLILVPVMGVNDLKDYQVMSTKPITIESDMVNEPQSVAIEKIELIYVANDLIHATAPGDSPYVQPVWLFSGHYANGATFDLLVQALKPEYLKP